MAVVPLHVLLLEDNPEDAELILCELKTSFDVHATVADNERGYTSAIDGRLDVVLADCDTASFPASTALQALRAREPDIPFIVISSSLAEATAMALLNSGAADYLLKDRLSRLGQAVQRAIDERQLRGAKREAETALRQAEERIRFAIEASRVGIWEADLTTGIIRWSPMLESLHGLAPGTFGGTLKDFLDRVDAVDRAAVECAIRRAAAERTDGSVLYRTRRPDGAIHWISASGRTSYAEDGTPLRAAGIGQDVTERVKLEEQYRQSQKMEAIGLLAGGIAHDFNNLLTAIEGYSTLMAEAMRPDDPLQSHLAEVRRAAERATGLTRQMLAFGRRQILDPRVLDLRDSVTSMGPMLQRLIGENVDIVVRENGDRGHVKADPGQIEQMILNLAINARDAMPRGGTLTFEVSDARLSIADARSGATVVPGRYTLLTVTDTGQGMDADTQARVFEPFFTTKQKGKGTGLGLSTVYGIVKQSGGYIWVESTPGMGARFSIYLPRVEEAVEPKTMRTPAESLTGSETILVVEDESAVRTLVRKALERYGYRVLTAGTPNEAIELARITGDRIHLLISDVVLPQMSGRALADRILPSKPETRLLFMSGYTDDAIVHHGVLDEGTPFLQKPFSPQALARKVRQVLA
jgi:two-component system cell cycle sensor histidine kinase/response regulator CckA